MKKIIITSGYFNPLHVGHIELMERAKELGDILVVIVNNDIQVKVKGSIPFMTEQERLKIIEGLKYPDKVLLSIDKDGSVTKSLKMVANMYQGEIFFAKGGDRNINNIPESEKKICQKLGIKVINNVGEKIQSSSWLFKKIIKKG